MKSKHTLSARLGTSLVSLSLAFLTIAGGAFAASGCKKSDDKAASGSGSSAQSSNAEAATKTFRFINRGDIISLDLNQVSYLQDFRVLYATREGLYTYDPQTLKPLPALAASATSSPDKKTWTFKLRPDGKWSNGDPVTAPDFVFSWKLMLEAPGEYTYLFYYIKGAKQYEADYAVKGGPAKADFATVGVKATDDETLVVELESPVLFLEDLLAFPPFYPRHAGSMEPFKEVKDSRTSYRDEYTRPPAVVTNGPFTMAEWIPQQKIVLQRDPNYWDKASVKSDTIEMIVNNDPLSAFQQYESGKIDWLADVAATIAVDLKDAGRKDLRTGPGFGTYFITLNCKPTLPGIVDKNPLADVRVRQALDLAISKEVIVNTITRMGEAPAQTYIPPGIFPGYTPRGGEAGNLEKAKKLLADAGYPGGKGFPSLPIIYNTDNPTRALIAQLLRSQWQKNLGIDIEVQGLELAGGYRPKIKSKDYALGLVAWFGDYGDPSTFTDKYLSNSQNNDSAWVVPEYDALLAAAAKETDPAKRYEILMQAEELFNNQRAIIPMYHSVNFSLYRDDVKGLYMNPKQLTLWKPVRTEK